MALSGDSGAGWGGVVLEVVFHHLVGTGAAHTGRAVLGVKGPKKAGVWPSTIEAIKMCEGRKGWGFCG